MSPSCVVVIPVYRVNPKPTEIASFRQCLTVLADYEIKLITFEELDLSAYEKISQKTGKTFKVEYFKKDYFKSLNTYNKLCLSSAFYDRFLNYEYMLIYQLDAWVFSNQLQYWCNKRYDYIGAPLFYDTLTNIFYGVGNGGFSLRRIRYCKDILAMNPNKPYKKPAFLWKFYYTTEMKIFKKHNTIISFFIILIKVLLKTFGFRNTLKYFIESSYVNEDFIFGLWASHAWNIKAKIPSCEEASLFAFEMNPSYFYEKNGKLPFGCHAFEKWEFDKFWHQFIRFV